MEVVHKKSQSSELPGISWRIESCDYQDQESYLEGGQGLVSTLIKGIFGAEYLKDKGLFLPVSEHSPSDVN